MATITRYDVSEDRRTVSVVAPCSRCGCHGNHTDLDGHLTCKTPAQQKLIAEFYAKKRLAERLAANTPSVFDRFLAVFGQ